MKLLIIIVIAILVSNAIAKTHEDNKRRFKEMLIESKGNRIFYGITFSIAALFGTFIVLGTGFLGWFVYLAIQFMIIAYMKEIGGNK